MLTQPEITEGNEKIAKFLGWYQEPDGQAAMNVTWFENGEFAKYVAYSIHNTGRTDLPFHRDWNWIMKVVTKLEDMSFCVHSANYCKEKSVKDNLNAHIGFDLGDEDYYCDISGSIKEDNTTRYFQIQRLDEDRIESLFKTIVMFIDAYNDKTIRIINVSNNEIGRIERK
jgi:hypothetical protein